MDTRTFFSDVAKKAACGLAVLALLAVGYGQRTAAPESISAPIAAYISEQSFWRGATLPSKQVQLVLFLRRDSSSASNASTEVLAIVPELNATFRSRLCGETLLPEGGWTGWLGWIDSTSTKIDPDEYLKTEISRFTEVVRAAQRSDTTLSLGEPDPAVLFKIDRKNRDRRIAQIEEVAGELYQSRPLRMRISDFSEFTTQINAEFPDQGTMVTFAVIRGCRGADKVVVGKELPLRSVRADLRKLIEENCILATVR